MARPPRSRSRHRGPSIQLHPHIAPAGFIDVWLGMADISQAPALSWTLDDEPADPLVLRAFAPIREGEFVADSSDARMFTGGFRFAVQGGGERSIRVSCESGAATLKTAPIPAELPDDRWLNILLVSCFDRHMERTPLLLNKVMRFVVSQPDLKPDLSFFMGDQVYLDVPPSEVVGKVGEPGVKGICEKFEQDYRLNWMLHLAGALSAAPHITVPDDHEFWNNYPQPVPWIPRTLKAAGREDWERSVRLLYDRFQRSVGMSDPASFDIGPLSFFVLDTRTWRLRSQEYCAKVEHVDALQAWALRVKAEGRYGIFMTGQSLFKEPVSQLFGLVADWELANYGDYKRIIDILGELASPERPVFCLTGDVHYGRVVQANDKQGRPRMYEVISSPSSLCSDPRSAHQPVLSTLFQRIFGEGWIHMNRPWPRHPTPSVPRLTLPIGQDRADHLQCVNRYSLDGNMVAVLGFREVGGRLQARVGYVQVDVDEAEWQPNWVGPFYVDEGIDVLHVLGLFGAIGEGIGRVTGI